LHAVESGLVRTAESDAWPTAVNKWLARFVSPTSASKAVGYAKLAVVQGWSLPHEAGMLLERHLQEQLFRGHDGPEGMRAYLEKRTAAFKGV
jgi:enoyl-CoA hydratase/carnithine racemase